MEIKIKNKLPYWVYFRKEQIPVSFYLRGKKITHTSTKTTCVISQEREELARGSVICALSDKYTNEKGRVESMKKALEILDLSKEERTEFWNEYFNRKQEKTYLQIDISGFSQEKIQNILKQL